MASNPITSDNKNVNYPETKLWGYTEPVVENITYLWTIKNFGFCPSKLDSPKFSTASNRNLEWYITAEQRHHDVSLHLTCTCINPDLIISSGLLSKAAFKFSILNTMETKTNLKESGIVEYSITSPSKCLTGFPDIYFLKDEANGLISNDTLRIFCEIDFVSYTKNISVPCDTIEFNEPDCGLTESLGNLLKNAEFSDVTFVVGDEELPAYKGILASRSDVFAAMFRHQMEEQKLNRVTITDIEPDVFKEMLHFIYTGKAPKIDQMAGDLLVAADKYALHKLKVMCEKTLYLQLSIETAAGILTIAGLFNASQLKAKTINFINTYFSQVTKTEGWKNLITEHPAIITNELSAFLENKPPQCQKTQKSI